MFPKEYETLIVKFEGTNEDYEAHLRTKAKTKEEFMTWLEAFESQTMTTWRVRNTVKTKGSCVLFKATYRCHHNTYPKKGTKSPHKKHTQCPALLNVTIKTSDVQRKIRSQDNLRKEYPTIIHIAQNHNHQLNAAEALKHRKMNAEVKQKLINLFINHHSPPVALHIHQQDLMEEHGDNYQNVLTDSALCPPLSAVYRLYYKTFKNQCGEENQSITRYLEDIEGKDKETSPTNKNYLSSCKHEPVSNVLTDIVTPTIVQCNNVPTDIVTPNIVRSNNVPTDIVTPNIVQSNNVPFIPTNIITPNIVQSNNVPTDIVTPNIVRSTNCISRIVQSTNSLPSIVPPTTIPSNIVLPTNSPSNTLLSNNISSFNTLSNSIQPIPLGNILLNHIPPSTRESSKNSEYRNFEFEDVLPSNVSNVSSINLDWDSLQSRLVKIVEKRKAKNSEAVYQALLEGITCLENCTTSEFIATLHCMGKRFSTRKQVTSTIGKIIKNEGSNGQNNSAPIFEPLGHGFNSQPG